MRGADRNRNSTDARRANADFVLSARAAAGRLGVIWAIRPAQHVHGDIAARGCRYQRLRRPRLLPLDPASAGAAVGVQETAAMHRAATGRPDGKRARPLLDLPLRSTDELD